MQRAGPPVLLPGTPLSRTLGISATSAPAQDCARRPLPSALRGLRGGATAGDSPLLLLREEALPLCEESREGLLRTLTPPTNYSSQDSLGEARDCFKGGCPNLGRLACCFWTTIPITPTTGTGS
ncbi:Hypothetical predicted protein [Podarcis lilfordi]|uniref:Uncharacterized protein n=1 Tax=Podarcis lilfordi TaxID=74358 RepID=A0AA35PKR7_9SAUR|nr:Hypothetical predicted protein [Podarcis lilfordi]